MADRREARREARIRYRFNDEGEGILEDTNTRVRVDDRLDNVARGRNIGLTLSHPNYLYVRFLDGQDHRVHDYFDETLPQYLERIGSNPIDTFSEANNTVSYVLNLDFEYNFGVQNNTLKFWRVNFRSPTTVASRRRDFRLVSFVIEQHLLFGCPNPLPDGFSELIQGMMAYRDRTAYLNGIRVQFNDSYLFSNHLALMTSSQRLIFIYNCKQKVSTLPLNYNNNYNTALQMMGDNRHWIQRFHFNYDPLCFEDVISHVVHETINVMRQRDITFNVDYNEYYGSDAFIQDLRTQYNDVGVVETVNRALIRMCRNLVVHLPESSRTVHDVDDETIAVMIMHAFGQELVNFQKCLFINGILEYFI